MRVVRFVVTMTLLLSMGPRAGATNPGGCGTPYNERFPDGSRLQSGDRAVLKSGIKGKKVDPVKSGPTFTALVAIGEVNSDFSQIYVSAARKARDTSADKAVTNGRLVRRLCSLVNVRTKDAVLRLPVFVDGGRMLATTTKKTSTLVISDRRAPVAKECWGGFVTIVKGVSVIVAHGGPLTWCSVDANGSIVVSDIDIDEKLVNASTGSLAGEEWRPTSPRLVGTAEWPRT